MHRIHRVEAFQKVAAFVLTVWLDDGEVVLAASMRELELSGWISKAARHR